MNDADGGLLNQPSRRVDTMVEIQSSTSSMKATISAHTTRLDRYGRSESPGHAHLGQNI